MKLQKCTSSILIVSLLICMPGIVKHNNVYAAESSVKTDNVSFVYDYKDTYDDYISKYKNSPKPSNDLQISGAKYSAENGTDCKILSTFLGKQNVLKFGDNGGWIEWKVNIPEEGLYQIGLKYAFMEEAIRDAELQLEIDGAIPFNEVRSCTFTRSWRDATEIQKDDRGNDIRPRQGMISEWNEKYFKDDQGLYKDPFQFFMSKGEHTLRLTSNGGSFVIDTINITTSKDIPGYSQVVRVNNNLKKTGDHLIKIQAEDSYKKNDATLYPIYDRSSPATEPYHPSKIRMNTIGGKNWSKVGQSISWKFDVPEDGYYNICLKYRQNLLQGLFVTRKIYIDGNIPFKEMENVQFPYNRDWKLKELGGDEPYLFYLKKGSHEISMEVTLGEFADIEKELQKSIFELNDLYRKIIMYTSTTPDTNRDYDIEKHFPDMAQILKNNADVLNMVAERFSAITGKKGSEVSLLVSTAHQMEDISKDPETIKSRLDKYVSNVSGLSAWVAKVFEQPLELDYFIIASPDMKMPDANAGIIARLKHFFATYISSYTEDYSIISNKKKNSKPIKVWIGTGRDQAQIIKGMIDDLFTPQTGININLELVQGSLIESTLAGRGPDVALMVAQGTPVNFAVRGALVDLSKFPDFVDVTKRFFSSAMVPYEFKGGYYAIPEQQTFNMMFYRKDVLAELGLQIPKTWADYYKIIPVLNRNNMQAGVGDLFSTLLFQYGGQYYKNNNTMTGFDEEPAIQAFTEWCDFYTKYDFPLTYDFYSRFKTGEMPIAIQPYTMYNKLYISAPEIRGLWDMAPIPGTAQSDGSIKFTQGGGGGVGAIMFNNTENKEEAWEFIKWWTSAEAQTRFGNEMEGLMGPAGRYPTANKEAFAKLPWNKKQYDVLLKEWQEVKEIPETPGSYYVERGKQNAYRAAVLDNQNARQMLFEQNREINYEIKRKLDEFGIK